MSPPPPHRLCLATVTDEGYLPGTVVLLASFLRHNPGFEGDLVVIHHGPGDAIHRRLAAFRRARMHPVSAELRARISELGERSPKLARRVARLHCIEAFALPYDVVLYVDSDVLCTGSARALLGEEGALLACPDLPYWQGKVRHAESFLALDEGKWPDRESLLPVTFNSGVMLIRPPDLADASDRLLAAIEPETWSKVRTGHVDQVVLNRVFRDRWTVLPDRYNRLVPPTPFAPVRRPAPMDRAVFVHLLARPKPWQPASPGLSAERVAASALWRRERDRVRDGDVTMPPS